MGICDNSRRVDRREVQAAVFDCVKGRVCLPHLIERYLVEYQREYAEASMQQGERITNLAARLREIDRQIENLLGLARMGASGADVTALLYADMAKLAAEKKQLEREGRQRPKLTPLSMNADDILQRLCNMLDDLGAALEGQERDAVRAKSILRQFISRVVVTPLDAQESVDGRGCGPVRITVEGSLAALLDLASIDCVVQRSDSPLPTLNPGKSTFSVYVDLPNSSLSKLTFADIAFVSGMLDDARAPLSKRDLIAARKLDLTGETSRSGKDAFQRVSAALKYLRADDLIRPITLGSNCVGWVWNDAALTDEEWRERVRDPGAVRSKVWRAIPPEAFVTVLSNGS